MKILMIVEHDNKNIKQNNFHTLTAAKELGGEIDVLLAGFHCDEVVKQASLFSNIKTIFVADSEEYQHQLAENMSLLIAEQAKKYDFVLASSTTFGKNILPRVAALLDVSMIADVTKILSATQFVRPIYAGNALATVESQEKIKILTIRGTAFSATPALKEPQEKIEKISSIFSNSLSQFVSEELTVSNRPELTNARVIISGGRGLKSAENFKLLEKIADQLGAAIGASRAAVDAGFAPNDYQVGQTGKVVAPDLYIAVGISGAIQHLAGMKDSKVIVAINSDPDAPIFEIADYGLVADLFSALPQLEAELHK